MVSELFVPAADIFVLEQFQHILLLLLLRNLQRSEGLCGWGKAHIALIQL